MKKLFTLFTMMLLFATGAWAEDITIDFTTKGYANAETVTSVEQDGITIAFDKGTNSNAPRYYNSGTAIRCYGSNTITASVSGKNITKIVFIFGSSDGSNAITADPGSFATDTWTGNASSVTFTIGGTSGNRRIQKMVFTIAASGDTRQATTIEFGGGYLTKFTYGRDGDGANLPTATVKTDAGEVTGATVTWTAEKVSGNDALTPTIVDNKVNIPENSWGKLNITASYAGDAANYQPSTKSYTLDVYKGYMTLQEIIDDFESNVYSSEELNAGIPTSLWMVEDYGGGMMFVTNPKVTYVNGAYTYIQDDYNYNLLLYGSGLGFSKGDIITSDQGGGEYVPLYGDLKTYNGLLELAVTQNNFQVYDTNATITPETITPSMMSLVSSMNAYLKIEDAVYKSADERNLTFTADETDFIVRQNWTNVAIDGLEEGTTYTLEGMGAIYNGTPQLYLISFEKTDDATAIKNIDADAENSNAPIYNLAGQRVNKDYKGVVIQNGKKRLSK